MKTLGGYFELELSKGIEYHGGAIHVNTGRNAFEIILRRKNFNKVYLPYYSCDALAEPVKRIKMKYEFYKIDENFEPIFDYNSLDEGEAFLYVNYFGVKDKFIANLSKSIGNLIIDNSQAFFSQPVKGVDTFYSARKFFGVPDGAYVYMDKNDEEDLEQDKSIDRTKHLLERIEFDAEYGYSHFLSNENILINQPIKRMSKLTGRILQSIDYENVKSIRKQNFKFFDKIYSDINQLKFDVDDNISPMVYPLLLEVDGLREYLINKKVFVATYWGVVTGRVKEADFEYKLTRFLIPLPVDQRYTIDDLKIISKLLEGKLT